MYGKRFRRTGEGRAGIFGGWRSELAGLGEAVFFRGGGGSRRRGWGRVGEVVGVGAVGLALMLPCVVVVAWGSEWLWGRMGMDGGGGMGAAFEAIFAVGGWARAWRVGLVVVGGPVWEEVFFRWGLLRGCIWVLGPWCGLVVGAAIFGLFHGFGWVFPPIFVLGLALGLGYARTKSLWTPILMHAGYNGLALAIFWVCGGG